MRKLLVADDTGDIRLLLRIILGTDFEIVVEAADGREALAGWHAHRDELFALVLDQRMPDMRGLDVAGEVLREAPGTRILLVSADLDEELRAAARAAGVTALIGKDQLSGLASHPALRA